MQRLLAVVGVVPPALARAVDARGLQQLAHQLGALGAQHVVEALQVVALGEGAREAHLQLGGLAAQADLPRAGLGEVPAQALGLGACRGQLGVQLLGTGLEIDDLLECALEQCVGTFVTHGLRSPPPPGGAGGTLMGPASAGLRTIRQTVRLGKPL